MPAADCPKCGMHNCASKLNYCMYCGHAFKDVMGHYKQNVETPLIASNQEEIKTPPAGQMLLFGTQYIRQN